MKRLYFLLLVISVALSYTLNAQGKFIRQDSISVPVEQTGGWANFVAGLDLDKDGKPEIYVVNNDVNDLGAELIPKIYKYELTNGKWTLVWSTTLDTPLQNSWAGLTAGDLDNDGITEIIWTPANQLNTTTNPNPDRIVAFKAQASGDGMGVEFLGGASLPNAKTKITTEANRDMRPFQLIVTDVDGDGKNELVYADRQAMTATGGGVSLGIMSVDKIPASGDGSEKWTMKASGKDASMTTMTLTSKYDIVILNNIIYLFDANGYVIPVKKVNNVWTSLPVQKGIAGTSGSYKSAQVVDLNGDGKKEIVFGGWSDGLVYLAQQQGDTLVSTQIGNFKKLGVARLNGGASGDIDGDGKLDLVFGSRPPSGTPPQGYLYNAICRVSYKGGAITDSNSYACTIIDSLIDKNLGQPDVISIVDLDGDKKPEVVYTSGYPRGPSSYNPQIPIVILKYQAPSSVERENTAAPSSYYMTQNYPNPFNPSTAIKFGLQKDANVSLRVFNILGQQVATIIDNQQMNAGTYNVNFDASSLSSGTYIYQLSFDNQIITKKMQLMK